jgi:hypothetical protein
MTPARVAIVLLLAFSVAQGIGQGAQLPDVVASNFDGSGRAQGWMSRLSDAFVWLLGAYLAFVGWRTVRILRRHRVPA